MKGASKMRKLVMLALLAAAIAALVAIPAAARAPGTNGRIAFQRYDPVLDGGVIYTANPDGTHEQLLSTGAEQAHWSPDGTRVAVDPDVGPLYTVAARIVNPDDGSYTDLLMPDPAHLTVFCHPWSPDGARLACTGQSFDFDPTLNGIYTIRSSDGGGLQRVASDPFGYDEPSAYSPNGKRLLFHRLNDSVDAFFTVKLDGSGLHQITPSGMTLNFEDARWSPQGNEIVFSAHTPDSSHFSSIWAVHADGSGLRRMPIDPCGGLVSDPDSFGCVQPSWSPDGQKIVFTRYSKATDQRDLYTVNADGSGLSQVTSLPVDETNPDWGIHPLEP